MGFEFMLYKINKGKSTVLSLLWAEYVYFRLS